VSSTAARTAPVRPRRLGTGPRRAVLIVHIAAAGPWLGIDVVMAVFVATALFTDDVAVRASSFQALEMFAFWPLLVSGLVCLVSGIVLGLGTRWGVVRYWWVAVKLALNVLLTVLVIVALRPGLRDAAERAGRWFAGEPVALAVGDLVFPPIVSSTALLIAITLSVVKPRGRIRRGPG
jgi:uncharacterized membrane protein